jgi:branched-chain amino acid transport system substrate-binding protein
MKDKTMNRRTFIKSTATAGLALSTLGFPGILQSATKMKEIPIAAVYPMTGPVGSFGQNMMRGWHIAVEEINAASGIKSLGGAKIKTELRDTEGKPRVGMAEVEKVANDKRIPIMTGCWGSNVTYPVSQMSEQYGLPHIIGIATQTAILRRGFKYVFRYAYDNERSGQNLVNFAEYYGKKSGQRPKRAALMTLDDNFGKSIAKWVMKALEKTEQKVVAEIYHPLKVTNVDVEVAKVKEAKPDVIYLTGFLNDSVLITRTLHAQKVNVQGIITAGGSSNPEYLKMCGKLADYYCAMYKFDSDLNRPLEKEFNAKMVKRYKVPANPFSACGYGMVYLIKDVLERAGTIDRNKVRDAIVATNITDGPAMIMPGKFIRFDERGENIGAIEHVNQVIDGAWHTVWPVEFKRKYNAIWPMPKWEER